MIILADANLRIMKADTNIRIMLIYKSVSHTYSKIRMHSYISIAFQKLKNSKCCKYAISYFLLIIAEKLPPWTEIGASKPTGIFSLTISTNLVIFSRPRSIC